LQGTSRSRRKEFQRRRRRHKVVLIFRGKVAHERAKPSARAIFEVAMVHRGHRSHAPDSCTSRSSEMISTFTWAPTLDELTRQAVRIWRQQVPPTFINSAPVSDSSSVPPTTSWPRACEP
jgi:hypothetical protein